MANGPDPIEEFERRLRGPHRRAITSDFHAFKEWLLHNEHRIQGLGAVVPEDGWIGALHDGPTGRCVAVECEVFETYLRAQNPRPTISNWVARKWILQGRVTLRLNPIRLPVPGLDELLTESQCFLFPVDALVGV